MKTDRVIIKVERVTREKLKAKGKKGDTYEDVIALMFAELEGATLNEREMDNLVEQMAALEHDQWTAWSRSVSESRSETPEEMHIRWEKLWIPYAKLTSDEKKADRYWVRKMTQLFERENIELSRRIKL